MSRPSPPPPTKLFMSIIFRCDEAGAACPELAKTLIALEECYGRIDYRSSLLAFDRTTYYNREMGSRLRRMLLSFEQLIARDRLVEVKQYAYQLETCAADASGKRTVNIDPGLLSPENLVLATGKNFTHRIYLGSGIFAEVTLIFQNKQFGALPWTYPDYASPEMCKILAWMRNNLMAQLKNSNL